MQFILETLAWVGIIFAILLLAMLKTIKEHNRNRKR
ncbi:hypothetical protein J2Z37_001679 [Ammoniphilus resinae]|uniref:Holin-like toxin n=1 Tax=Ammoniphilus resinae TaxID=861532 RepID=A0ABS4GN38_9BACL|nr:hypothetical protein [Ammoniphilus resinae]